MTEDPLELSSQFVEFQLKVDKFSFSWTINNFSLVCDQLEILESPKFTVAGYDDNLTGYIKLRLNSQKPDLTDYIGLFVYLVNHSKAEVNAMVKFEIVNPTSAFVLQCPYVRRFPYGIYNNGHGYNKFIRKNYLFDEANKLLPNDTLTIVCNMSIVNNAADLVKNPECRLSDDWAKLFETKRFSDVTIVTPGKEFEAHKVVLAARCPVFATMFDPQDKNNNTEENQTVRVDVHDVDAPVMEELLRFIYTGKFQNVPDIACDLLIAADKYWLKRLKAICENILVFELSVEKAAKQLIFSDFYSAHQLKAQVLAFIKAHAIQVMDTAAWKSMVISHPLLVNEVCHVLAAS